MKYGESLFDIIYLLTAVITGLAILRKEGNKTGKWMGIAVLVLGCGDAFHLVPRVLNYFVDADFTIALGVGKLITSITMTIFYVILYHVGCDVYKVQPQKTSRVLVHFMAAVRIALCLFPQNGWISNKSGMLWGILRNIPFVILGVLVMLLYYQNRLKVKQLRHIWLWILLSFAFYIPVAVFAGVLPLLGMLMLPKTICYIFIIIAFYRTVQ